MLGGIYGTDDGIKHVSISGDHIAYLDRKIRRGYFSAFRGVYDSQNSTENYSSAGTGTFTLDPLAFGGVLTALPEEVSILCRKTA